MLVVGHRGAPHQAPENTIASYEAALAIGVDAIELDVHLSRDGHLVVIHDVDLRRTTNGEGAVHERSLAELRALDAGGWFAPAFSGQRIPTFDEALDCIAGRAAVQVEIKGATDGVTEAVVDTLRARALLADTLVTSFHLHRLPLARSLEPRLQLGALVWGRTRDGRAMTAAEMVEGTRQAHSDIMLVWHEWIDSAAVDAARAAGLPVGAAGGDASEADMRRLLGLDVVRMTSNYPDTLRRLVDSDQNR